MCIDSLSYIFLNFASWMCQCREIFAASCVRPISFLGITLWLDGSRKAKLEYGTLLNACACLGKVAKPRTERE